MNETIIIKERRNDLLIKGIPLLVLIIASLLLTFAPEIFTEITIMPAFFYFAGGLLTLLFGTLFALVLLRQSRPDNAMVITSRGFTDIRANLEDNLPAIIILQSDVMTDLNELKDIFNRFAREARTLKTSAPKKQKNNPFTTEDVLRAFGKLPADAPAGDESDPTPAPVPAADEAEAKEAAPGNASPAADGDSFFNEILGSGAESGIPKPAAPQKAAAPAAPAAEIPASAKAAGDDELPPEAREMLSKVRSSRITELEKILAGDIPAREYTAPAAESTALQDPAADADTASEAENAPEDEEESDNVTFEDILRGSKND